jgi:hypothetical protein
MASVNEVYREFPVVETIDLRDYSDIEKAVEKMVETYVVKSPSHEFSYRLLLPRGDKSTNNAKRLGIQLQAYFLLSLKSKNAKPNLKDIRYLHDADHYGWLLVDPFLFHKTLKYVGL